MVGLSDCEMVSMVDGVVVSGVVQHHSPDTVVDQGEVCTAYKHQTTQQKVILLHIECHTASHLVECLYRTYLIGTYKPPYQHTKEAQHAASYAEVYVRQSPGMDEH